MEYVTISLREVVPQLSEQDAISIMLEAHNTGVGLVIVCDLEPAEFYSESLKSKGISSSIEKDSIILEAQKKKIRSVNDLEQSVKEVLKTNQKTILLVIYNSQNQRRYIGVKLD